jgi:hypothetical protein
MNLQPIYHEEGIPNMAGLQRMAFCGYISDVAVFPEIPKNPVNLEDAAVILENIVMKPGKFMQPLYGTPETGGLTGESQGERDGRSTKRTATWFHPTTSEKSLGAVLAFQNRSMFFLFRENTGNLRLMGSPAIPAEVAASDTTGTAFADRKGVTYTITDAGFGPAPIYRGLIPTDSAAELQV